MFTDQQIDRMREELANPELMKQRYEQQLAMERIVAKCKQMFIEQGRDFDVEFAAYQQ